MALVVISLLVGACGGGEVPESAARPDDGAPASTTTTGPTRGARVGTATIRAGVAVPAEGFVVVDDDRLVVADENGKPIAEGEAAGFFSNDHGHPLDLVVEGGEVRLEEAPHAPLVTNRFPSGCLPESRDELPDVARCGPSEPELRRIEVVDVHGRRTLIETPPRSGASEVLGHWTSVQLSPDTRWVLAMWSGECESPTTFLLPVGPGDALTVDGTPMRDWASAPESVPVGWTSDGRARFVVGAGACGSGLTERGVYAVEPGGRPALLYQATGQYPSAYAWRMVSTR
jgi:hypothetical protein